ncbi:MAG: hypothetical protein ACI8WB_000321 [Phenylobacterium sp.]
MEAGFCCLEDKLSLAFANSKLFGGFGQVSIFLISDTTKPGWRPGFVVLPQAVIARDYLSLNCLTLNPIGSWVKTESRKAN